ncbi:MAG: acetolactate decarboxylase [Kiritimatiellia bacterium]
MKIYSLLILFFFTALSMGCTSSSPNMLTQVASIDRLLAGGYDGEVTLAELAEHGDFGIGTYQAVDGEMILLEGKFYQALSDGTVRVPPSSTLTPFAAVVNFQPDFSADLAAVDFQGLSETLDKLIPDQNQFVALRIDGSFAKMKIRSPPRQSRPYPPLQEVIHRQAVFDLENVTGTLVGFRCPPYVEGLNVPGYHFHFISDDRMSGGHVLELQLARGKLSADRIHEELMILLPSKSSFTYQTPRGPTGVRALESTER